MPPGIWWLNTFASMTAAFGLSMCSRYLGSTDSRWSPISSSLSRSSPVSLSVPRNVVTSGSTAGWDVRRASGASAASITSTPASTALTQVIEAMPLV